MALGNYAFRYDIVDGATGSLNSRAEVGKVGIAAAPIAVIGSCCPRCPCWCLRDWENVDSSLKYQMILFRCVVLRKLKNSVRSSLGTDLVSRSLWVRPHPKSVDFHDAENRHDPYRMIMRHVKDPLDYLFDLGALGKIKFLIQFRSVRARVPPSEEENERQNYSMTIGNYQ
ncbi:hypothetical protein TNCV_4364191 [Trichonephila clavipes]|nr:hypothetical protein TNCV_4364191 [Trichonephila clavipes]